MTISVPVETNFVSTDVVNSTPSFVNDGTPYDDDTYVEYQDGVYVTKGMGEAPQFNYLTGAKKGDTVLYNSLLYTVLEDVNYPTVSEIIENSLGAWACPTLAELTIQGVDYVVGDYRFTSVVKGTEPHTALVTEIRVQATGVLVVEAPLSQLIDGVPTQIYNTGYIDANCLACNLIYFNGALYHTQDTYTVNPQEDARFSLGVDPSKYLTYVGLTDQKKPLDGKNYSIATKETIMQYTVKGGGNFNMIALGSVKANSAKIDFKNLAGEVVTTIERAIDTSRDESGNLEPYNTTEVFYSPTLMGEFCEVDITLLGAKIELGTIQLGVSVDAGMTNLQIKNSFKDFSTLTYTPFGNAEYVERARVSTYNGTVDIPIKDYDRINRLIKSLGKQRVIVDGSDAENKAPDGNYIFSSTQMIGRFLSFTQSTKVKDNDMDRLATYSFTFEETV